VLSQFTPEPGSRWTCLAPFIPVPDVYAAGRLDADSEGLLLLTADGRLQQRLTDPAFGHWRRYWVQVEGLSLPPQPEAIQLRAGVMVQGPAHPARQGPAAHGRRSWRLPACPSANRRSATACRCPPAGWNWSCGRGATARCGG
jgi:16S rRNA U516 pseudouridylate synthase RsuA-like enzyme